MCLRSIKKRKEKEKRRENLLLGLEASFGESRREKKKENKEKKIREGKEPCLFCLYLILFLCNYEEKYA